MKEAETDTEFYHLEATASVQTLTWFLVCLAVTIFNSALQGHP